MKAYKRAYEPFRLGAHPYRLKVADLKAPSREVRLARGIVVHLVTGPDGRFAVIEKKSGGYVGDSIAEVKANLHSAPHSVTLRAIAKQQAEIAKGTNIDPISEEEWWKPYQRGRMVEAMKAATMPLLTVKCATCPFRPESPYRALAPSLAISAITDASRICHSTGSSAINRRTGKPPALCRGARDVALAHFHAVGLLDAPTDESWAKKWAEMEKRETGLRGRAMVKGGSDA